VIRKELDIFLSAVMFYTRIPVPVNTVFSNDLLNKSIRYFPLIGIIVGGIGALVFWGLESIFPFPVALIISMVATIFVTGAFHEDGFADFCDGFGGGYTRERILEIMKDSRIGTYGSVGLFCMLMTKFFVLFGIPVSHMPIVFIAGHAFSRLLPVGIIYTSIYVREDASSKTRPIGQKGSALSFWVAFAFGIIPLIMIPWLPVLLIAIGSFLLFIVFKWYIKRTLGGYTGDVLGALQQLAEIFFYLGYLFCYGNMP
jgi:adenosylcobinamide-GDP ribazoletransferase